MSDDANKSPPVIALCERHRSADLRQAQIHQLLGKLEEMLADRHNWFELTRVQRRHLWAARPFHDLEDELEEQEQEAAQLVLDLRDLPALSLREAIAKLEVVARVIEPDDYPDAHAVLAGTVADLKKIQAELPIR
jgi:hypothetical protein